MIRVRPPDDASPWARPKRSRPATRSPRRLSASAADEPCAPSPMTTASKVSMTRRDGALGPHGLHPIEDQALDALERHALLGHRIAVADRHGPVVKGVDVDGD